MLVACLGLAAQKRAKPLVLACLPLLANAKQARQNWLLSHLLSVLASILCLLLFRRKQASISQFFYLLLAIFLLRFKKARNKSKTFFILPSISCLFALLASSSSVTIFSVAKQD
jgi:hypothetical protein